MTDTLASMPKYESYKDSNMNWFGDIPDHWILERSKWLFYKAERPVTENDEVVTCFRDGQVTLRKNRRTEGFTNAIQEHGYQGIRKGDLIIHAMDAFAGAIGVSDSDGKSSPVYSACVPKKQNYVDVFYYAYLMRNLALSGFIQSLAKGIRERSTDFRFIDFSNLELICPPIEEQMAIVSFLDRKSAQIDQAIAIKEKQIELLKERKQILIQNAITRGLDPNVPMKDSGVEWMGDIPKHWEIKKPKHFGIISSGDAITNSQLKDEGDYEVFGGNGFMGYTNKYNVSGENIIIGRVGAQCGNIRYISDRKWISDNALIYKAKQNSLYRYLALLFNAADFNRLNVSNAQPLITGTKVMNFKLPLPPEDEQEKIIKYIEFESEKNDKGVSLQLLHIEKLKEYKSTLINSAVTGKIKVA